MASHRTLKTPQSNTAPAISIDDRLNFTDDLPLSIVGDKEPSRNVTYPKVALGFGNITTQLVYFTPEVAHAFLKNRLVQKQRTIRPQHLESLIDDARRGRFKLNGQTVIIDSDGNLMDGQHRLEAVVRSGVGFWSVVVRGINPAYFCTIDSVTRRSAGDTLKSLGYSNTNSLGAAVALLWRYEGEHMLQNRVISQAMVAEVIGRHPELSASVNATQRLRKISPSRAVPGFCHYVFSRINPELTDAFFKKLLTGENLSKGDPALALRDKLRNSVGIEPRDLVAYFFKALNAARHGQKLLLIRYNPKLEEFPIV